MTLAEYAIKPSRWRRQHGRTEAVPDQIQDSEGNIGAPYRGLGLLDNWERSGQISKEMKAAGDTFHELFQRAGLAPLQAADMSRVGGSPAPGKHRGHVGALEAVHDAVRRLGGMGSPAGCGAWFCFGCEMSIREWAAREGWRGRPIDQKVAAGILVAALGMLAEHFEY